MGPLAAMPAPVRHTELIGSAVKKAAKRAEAIYLHEADHDFKRGDDRLALLKALGRFLAANL